MSGPTNHTPSKTAKTVRTVLTNPDLEGKEVIHGHGSKPRTRFSSIDSASAVVESITEESITLPLAGKIYLSTSLGHAFFGIHSEEDLSGKHKKGTIPKISECKFTSTLVFADGADFALEPGQDQDSYIPRLTPARYYMLSLIHGKPDATPVPYSSAVTSASNGQLILAQPKLTKSTTEHDEEDTTIKRHQVRKKDSGSEQESYTEGKSYKEAIFDSFTDNNIPTDFESLEAFAKGGEHSVFGKTLLLLQDMEATIERDIKHPPEYLLDGQDADQIAADLRADQTALQQTFVNPIAAIDATLRDILLREYQQIANIRDPAKKQQAKERFANRIDAVESRLLTRIRTLQDEHKDKSENAYHSMAACAAEISEANNLAALESTLDRLDGRDLLSHLTFESTVLSLKNGLQRLPNKVQTLMKRNEDTGITELFAQGEINRYSRTQERLPIEMSLVTQLITIHTDVLVGESKDGRVCYIHNNMQDSDGGKSRLKVALFMQTQSFKKPGIAIGNNILPSEIATNPGLGQIFQNNTFKLLKRSVAQIRKSFAYNKLFFLMKTGFDTKGQFSESKMADLIKILQSNPETKAILPAVLQNIDPEKVEIHNGYITVDSQPVQIPDGQGSQCNLTPFRLLLMNLRLLAAQNPEVLPQELRETPLTELQLREDGMILKYDTSGQGGGWQPYARMDEVLSDDVGAQLRTDMQTALKNFRDLRTVYSPALRSDSQALCRDADMEITRQLGGRTDTLDENGHPRDMSGEALRYMSTDEAREFRKDYVTTHGRILEAAETPSAANASNAPQSSAPTTTTSSAPTLGGNTG